MKVRFSRNELIQEIVQRLNLGKSKSSGYLSYNQLIQIKLYIDKKDHIEEVSNAKKKTG